MSVFSSLKITSPTHFKLILFKPGRLSGLQNGVKMLYFQIKRKITISSEKVSIRQYYFFRAMMNHDEICLLCLKNRLF